jgi:pimeloyl-ACP methyl ester carboxylesterase
VPVPAGRFVRAYLKAPVPPSEQLTVYIEGDGARWRAPDLPPADPTPENPLALHLALADPAPAVGYIGRPCQYLDDDTLADCDPALWIGGRLSETAVGMVDQAVDALVAATHARRVVLIGHSGGGAMAALVAARRRDVACLATVAAPLDIAAWTEAVGVSPLRTSINPADQTARLAAIPQVHYTGGRDAVVPPASIARYLQGVPAAREVRVAKFDHDCCWVEEWAELRARACP